MRPIEIHLEISSNRKATENLRENWLCKEIKFLIGLIAFPLMRPLRSQAGAEKVDKGNESDTTLFLSF